MIKAGDVCQYVQDKAEAETDEAWAVAAQPKPKMSAFEVPAWLATATTETLLDFHETGYRPWVTTVGPNDIIFTPAGYVTTHSVSVADPCVGYRVGVLSINDVAVFQDFFKLNGSAGKSNNVMEQALIFLGAPSVPTEELVPAVLAP